MYLPRGLWVTRKRKLIGEHFVIQPRPTDLGITIPNCAFRTESLLPSVGWLDALMPGECFQSHKNITCD